MSGLWPHRLCNWVDLRRRAIHRLLHRNCHRDQWNHLWNYLQVKKPTYFYLPSSQELATLLHVTDLTRVFWLVGSFHLIKVSEFRILNWDGLNSDLTSKRIAFMSWDLIRFLGNANISPLSFMFMLFTLLLPVIRKVRSFFSANVAHLRRYITIGFEI